MQPTNREQKKASGVTGGVVPPTGPNALFNVPGAGPRVRRRLKRLKEGPEKITGNLCRGEDGGFAACDGAADSDAGREADKLNQAAARDKKREQERAALEAEKDPKKRAALREQFRQERNAERAADRERAAGDRVNRAEERAKKRAEREAAREAKKREREEAKRAAAEKPKGGGGGGAKPDDEGAAALARRQALMARLQRALVGTKALGDPLRVVEHGGYTIEGNPTVRHAYQHAKRHDEVSEGWLAMMLERGWAERRADGAHVLRPVSPEPQAQKAMRPKRAKLWRSAYAEAKAAGHDRAAARKAASVMLRRDSAERARRMFERASLAVFKDATGADRWLAITTSAYEDRDQEWIARKAIRTVVERGDRTGRRGVLRYWHVPGCDFGECDYQATAQDDRFLIESGTFYSPRHAAVVKEAAARGYQMSPGFTHSPAEPGPLRVYTDIDPFERSFVPRGRASNPFTRLTAMGAPMLTPEKRKELISLGIPEAMVDQFNAAVVATDKEAQRVSTFKSSDSSTPPTVYTGPDGAPGVIVNGAFVALKAVAEKAPMPPEQMMEAAMTEAADAGAELELEEPVGEDEDLMDMTVGGFKALLAAALEEVIGGISGRMAEMKQQYEAMGKAFGAAQATKDDAAAATAAELATLKESRDALAAQVTALDARLKELEGDQPAVKPFKASESPATVVPAPTTTKQAPANAAEGAYYAIFGEAPQFPIS